MQLHHPQVAPTSAETPLLKCPAGVVDFVAQLTGRRVSESTVRYWIAKGLRPRGGGPRVRLRTLRFGSSTMTTEQAILDFAAGTAGAEQELAPLSRRSADVAAYLDAEGL